MPYTLKPNKIYAKDKNGQYLPQNILTDDEIVAKQEKFLKDVTDSVNDAAAAKTAAQTAQSAAEQALAQAQSPVVYGAEQTLNDDQKALARSNIGAAKEADVSDLKSAINNSYTPIWVDGKKVNSLSGNLIDDANSSYTKIDVAPLMRIKGFTRANGAYSGIVFYTIDDKFISGFSNSASTYNWNFDLIAPQNSAYALISCSANYKNNFYCNYYNITPSTINTSNELLKQPKTFYCGATRELTTLKAGIEEATKYMNSILYVDAGTYDLIEEFGNDYFENLTNSNQLAGLRLKNRIHIIFSPNSKVVSNYSGSNQYAKSLYSPFNAAEYGFTIENLTLECSNCRYAVHDERNGGTEQYKSEYINCNLYIDNSANEYWVNSTCIGGGLGSNAEIIIKDCVFKGVNAEARYGVYYHQSNKASDTNYKSKVIINGNYFVTGCVQIDDARTDSTGNGKSEYLVTNNSFPVKYPNTNDEGIYVANMTNPSSLLFAWDNNIRSN